MIFSNFRVMWPSNLKAKPNFFLTKQDTLSFNGNSVHLQNNFMETSWATHRVPSEDWPVLGRYWLHKHLSPSLSGGIQPLCSLRPRSVRAVAVIFGYNNPGCHRQECCQPHGAAGTAMKTSFFTFSSRNQSPPWMFWQRTYAMLTLAAGRYY